MNIFTEEKRHAAKHGDTNDGKALCGASGNAERRVTQSSGVTCLRCLRIMETKKDAERRSKR